MSYSMRALVFGLVALAVGGRQNDALGQIRRTSAASPDSLFHGRVQGKVVDDRNEPVKVVLHIKPVLDSGITTGIQAPNDPLVTQSFANGSFYFDDIVPGMYVISIADSRYLLKDTRVDLREPENFSQSIVIALERNDGTVHGPAPLPADLEDLDKLDMTKLAATTTPSAFDEFGKGVQSVRLNSKDLVVAANGKATDPAEEHFKKAISLDPNFYEALVQLGQEQRRQHHSADAVQTLEQAVSKNSGDDRPLRALGALYVEQKQFQKSADVLIKAGSLTTLDAADRFNLGIDFESLNNPGAAQQQLLTAITLMPGRNPQAYLHLHNAYVQLNRLEDAAKTLEDFVRLFPNDPNRKTAEERIKKLRAAVKKQP